MPPFCRCKLAVSFGQCKSFLGCSLSNGTFWLQETNISPPWGKGKSSTQQCLWVMGYVIVPWTIVWSKPLKFSIAPENGWLEEYFPFGMVYFQGLYVKLPAGKGYFMNIKEIPAWWRWPSLTTCSIWKMDGGKMRAFRPTFWYFRGEMFNQW